MLQTCSNIKAPKNIMHEGQVRPAFSRHRSRNIFGTDKSSCHCPSIEQIDWGTSKPTKHEDTKASASGQPIQDLQVSKTRWPFIFCKIKGIGLKPLAWSMFSAKRQILAIKNR